MHFESRDLEKETKILKKQKKSFPRVFSKITDTK